MLKPYDGDLGYLEAELQWIEARCQRIAAQRRLEAAAGRAPSESSPYGPPAESPRQIQAKIKRHRTEEDRLRTEIDGRLTATRATPQPMALDLFCSLY